MADLCHRLTWAHGSAEIWDRGAVLRRVGFTLPGRVEPFRPFADAPWADEPADPAWPGHLHRLGGDFACVPFGAGGIGSGIVAEWQDLPLQIRSEPEHGAAANACWRFTRQEADAVSLSLEDGPLRLQRSIRADPAAPALDCTLEVANQGPEPLDLPIALHPILRLPEAPGGLILTARFTQGWTYPAEVPGGVMRLQPGAGFSDLKAVPAAGGGTCDCSSLPLDGGRMEDILLLAGLDQVTAAYPGDSAGLTIGWDGAQMPLCQIWISDRSLDFAPWNRRFRGIGIEPGRMAFDLGPPVSRSESPLTRAGWPTVFRLIPGQPLILRHRLAAHALTPSPLPPSPDAQADRGPR